MVFAGENDVSRAARDFVNACAVERLEYRGRLFMYGYDGETAGHDAEFVLMAGKLRNEGLWTPRIGAVSNTPNGVFTIFLLLLLISTTTDGREMGGELCGVGVVGLVRV